MPAVAESSRTFGAANGLPPPNPDRSAWRHGRRPSRSSGGCRAASLFPESTIGWLIEERWAELLCTLPTPRAGPRSAQRPLVDRIHTVNMKQWRASPFSLQTWERIAAGLSDLRAQHYDVAIDLQGSIRSSLLAHWSGAPLTYGFAQPRENLASMFYNRQVIASGNHVVEQNLSLAQAVARRSLLASQVELPHRPWRRAGVRPLVERTWHREIRTAQSWRRVGCETMAARPLWSNCKDND